MEKNLFGNHPVVKTEAHGPPHASDLSVTVSSSSAPSMLTDGMYANGPSSDIVEIDVPSSAGNFMKSSSPVGVRFFLIAVSYMIRSWVHSSFWQDIDGFLQNIQLDIYVILL